MISTIKPTGAYGGIIRYRFEESGRYYIVDSAYNRLEISKEDYMKLNAPVRKRLAANEVQEINSGK